MTVPDGMPPKDKFALVFATPPEYKNFISLIEIGIMIPVSR